MLELKTFMKNQTKGSDQIAKIAIFEEMPQLYLKMQKIIDSNEYFKENAGLLLYTKLETLFFNLKDTALSHEIIQEQFKNDSETMNIAAKLNKDIYDLTILCQQLQEETCSIFDKILNWLQLLLPKQVQGGSVPEYELLLQFTTELTKTSDEAQSFYDSIAQYYNKRGGAIKWLKKVPCFDLYRVIIQLDIKQVAVLTDGIRELQMKLLSYYSGLVGNYDKLLRLQSRITQMLEYVQ